MPERAKPKKRDYLTPEDIQQICELWDFTHQSGDHYNISAQVVERSNPSSGETQEVTRIVAERLPRVTKDKQS